MRVLFLIAGPALLCACQAFHGNPQAEIAKLAGSHWRLESIGGVPVAQEIESTLEIDAKADVVGRGGCNPYVSDIVIDSGAIRFTKPVAAQINCTSEETDQESLFFDALTGTYGIRYEKDHLVLLDLKGSPLARLKWSTILLEVQ